jgi:hypothetical protein
MRLKEELYFTLQEWRGATPGPRRRSCRFAGLWQPLVRVSERGPPRRTSLPLLRTPTSVGTRTVPGGAPLAGAGRSWGGRSRRAWTGGRQRLRRRSGRSSWLHGRTSRTCSSTTRRRRARWRWPLGFPGRPSRPTARGPLRSGPWTGVLREPEGGSRAGALRSRRRAEQLRLPPARERSRSGTPPLDFDQFDLAAHGRPASRTRNTPRGRCATAWTHPQWRPAALQTHKLLGDPVTEIFKEFTLRWPQHRLPKRRRPGTKVRAPARPLLRVPAPPGAGAAWEDPRAGRRCPRRRAEILDLRQTSRRRGSRCTSASTTGNLNEGEGLERIRPSGGARRAGSTTRPALHRPPRLWCGGRLPRDLHRGGAIYEGQAPREYKVRAGHSARRTHLAPQRSGRSPSVFLKTAKVAGKERSE